MKITRRTILQLATAPLALGTAGAFGQAAYPDRPIRIVIGYPAGQSVDAIARAYAVFLSKELGQSIFIDNKPGANGMIGASEVKQARPDGYTLLFGTSGQMTINPSLYKKIPYDTVKDFAPIGLGAAGSVFLVANPAFPPNNIQELIAYAKARPGKIDYGSGGAGITAHLAMELLQSSAGIKLNHIPYKGSPAAITDLIGGQVSLMMDSTAVLQHVKSGKLKMLGTTGRKRNAAAPEVPTVSEQGVKDFEVTSWTGLWAPADTPAPILQKVNAALLKASTDPATVALLRAIGVEVATSRTPAEYGTFIVSELSKWGSAVAQAGVQLDN